MVQIFVAFSEYLNFIDLPAVSFFARKLGTFDVNLFDHQIRRNAITLGFQA